MSCPLCGRLYCDHSPAERGQTFEQVLEDMYAPHVPDGDGSRRVSRGEYRQLTGQEWPEQGEKENERF